jgi:hypothetical protein
LRRKPRQGLARFNLDQRRDNGFLAGLTGMARNNPAASRPPLDETCAKVPQRFWFRCGYGFHYAGVFLRRCREAPRQEK